MIIPKMYDIELISNNYNPDANTSITITVTATDYNGNPVIGESLIIKHNGTAVGNAVTTNGSGQANVVTTCGSGGTHQFTCKSASCIITVNPYPIGSIYISTNSTDPSTLFGGTWTQIEDRFLLASGTTYSTLGDMDGEATHTLTTDEMPSHTHTQNSHNHTPHTSDDANNFVQSKDAVTHTTGRPTISGSGQYYYLYKTANSTVSAHTTTANATATNQNTGGGQSHNNMPPYLVVSVWERTA